MTVSPNRPQDGNLPPKVGGSGAESNDRSSLASLPPTLFRLPNLAGSKPTARKPIAREDTDRAAVGSEPLTSNLVFEEESRDGTRADTWASDETMARAAVGAQFQAASHEQPSNRADNPLLNARAEAQTGETEPMRSGVMYQDETQLEAKETPESSSSEFVDPFRPLEMTPDSSPERDTTTPDKASPDTAAPRTTRPPIPDLPAGRSWMESLGSHGVVIVLLLVVVAAALLTGKGEDDPTATSLSTQSELLNFDELTEDLPLPTHRHEVAQVEDATSQTVTAAESTQTPASTQVATTEVPAVSSASTPPAIETTQEVVTSQPAANVNAEPMTSLQDPLPVKVQTSNLASGEGLSATGIQTNQFVVPDSGVAAKPVSDRSASSANTDASLPSLEELAGLQDQQASQQAAKANAATRILTKTPVGVSDWSKYLPPLNANVAPDAGTSSFNN